MKAILFVGHGSPKEKGNKETLQFIEGLKEKWNFPLIESCFLEHARPTIAEGIETCVTKGATHVALIPIMFLPAGHSKIHIPHEIDEAKKKYPSVRFTYGKPIGVHAEVVDLLADKVRKEVGIRAPENTSLVLIGRGSSEPDTNSEVYKLGRLLSEKIEHVPVEVSFIGVTVPTVEEAVERQIALGKKNVIFVPCFFFSGILMDRVYDKVRQFQEIYPHGDFQTTSTIGFHPRLEMVLFERVQEALDGEAFLNCDMCQYRLFAVEHMEGVHHHHHHHDHS